MKHTLKSKIFKGLSLFPNFLGYPLYHFLQHVGSKITLENKIEATKSSYETIKRILSVNDINLEGKKIAELMAGSLNILLKKK
jgi:hypothetical protein